jgi:predicted transposase YdaD
MKQILDEKSMVEGAREEGKIEGMAEGREVGKIEGMAEGRAEGKEEAARNFLKLGISEEVIAQGTGLSINKIREIKSKLEK